MDIYEIKIGDTITPEMGLELCKHFGLGYLVERLEGNLDKYKPFIFDGVSGLPDNFAALLADVDEKDLTYLVALPHDLQFGYGMSGDKIEEATVNEAFRDNFLKIGAEPWRVWIALKLVESVGAEELGFNFCWAFASKETTEKWETKLRIQ